VRRRKAPKWLLPVLVLGIVGYLYFRPITTYLETRDQLDGRRAEVATLRAERARVSARLARATSLDELARAARRIGYVRPGEHLFIVKGTAAWKRAQADG
jgi:cell division protein FtsB